MIKVATVFSGIGSAEWAFKRINVPHEIVFACDNGERYLLKSFEQIEIETEGLSFEKKKQYIENIYEATGKVNYVQDSYMANYNVAVQELQEAIFRINNDNTISLQQKEYEVNALIIDEEQGYKNGRVLKFIARMKRLTGLDLSGAELFFRMSKHPFPFRNID
jgi:site-specific DNA-cytosine methylase